MQKKVLEGREGQARHETSGWLRGLELEKKMAWAGLLMGKEKMDRMARGKNNTRHLHSVECAKLFLVLMLSLQQPQR